MLFIEGVFEISVAQQPFGWRFEEEIWSSVDSLRGSKRSGTSLAVVLPLM